MIALQAVVSAAGLATLGVAPFGIWADVPVDPGAPEAKQWLVQELGKPEYQAAKPTWFDMLSKAFWDWLSSLTAPGGTGWAGLIPVVIAVVIIGLIVWAFIVFGMPRINRRRAADSAIFGADDRRTAEAIRHAGEIAARSGDWTLAIEEAYRALARGLEERTVISVYPGTTARVVASKAAIAFPDARDPLTRAAACFDRVRYFAEPGTQADYAQVADLDATLSRTQPARLPELSGNRAP